MYWNEEVEPEGYGDINYDEVVEARRWLRHEADQSKDPFVREMLGDLRWLELKASPFFLGLDHDMDDLSDIDEVGPF